MDTSSTTQMAQILVKHWRYRGISRTKLIWTPIGRIVMGKTIRGSSCWTWMGKTTKLSMSICSLRTGFFLGLCGWHKKWLERSRVWFPCGRNSWKLWSWRTNFISWPLCIWDVLGANANRLTSLLENIQRCLNHVFLLDQLDKYQGEKSLTLKQSRGPTTWKDMLENALSDTATWQTKQWRSYTKLQVFAWMTINLNRKNLNHLENYHKFAHKLLSNVCSWNDLEDQTFCGRWTNLQEQSQNGLRHAADDWQDWFHTFITRMDSDKVVMWATLPSIVDWVCFKTQILLAALKTQNLPLGESYVSSEAEHLSQSVGCARSKRQYPTVLQNLKSFLWMLDCAWTACSRPLGHCDWSDTFNKQHRKTW